MKHGVLAYMATRIRPQGTLQHHYQGPRDLGEELVKLQVRTRVSDGFARNHANTCPPTTVYCFSAPDY